MVVVEEAGTAALMRAHAFFENLLSLRSIEARWGERERVFASAAAA